MVKTCITILAPHVTLSQFPSRNPQSSDFGTDCPRSIDPCGVHCLRHLSPPISQFFRCSQKITTLSRDSWRDAFPIFLLGMAVDPLHDRLSISPNVSLCPLRVRRVPTNAIFLHFSSRTRFLLHYSISSPPAVSSS